jgi:ABC-type transport system involved in multi-copper enzyme maturation permease subunit
MVSLVRAELRKLLGLPTAWVGLVLGTLIAPVIVLLNAPYIRRAIAAGTLTDTSDLGLRDLGIGLIGPMILGVIVVSSEYTSTNQDAPGARQLTATLTAVPDRRRLLAAKTTALVLVVAAQAAVTAAATLTLTQVLHGEHAPTPAPARVTAAILYWTLTALLAYAITLITRNGIVPLTLLIINSSVVSVSYLLTKVTDLAAYLPDIVGAQMFIRSADFPVEIAPVTAGLVMTAWVVALLAVGAVLFYRRDV